MSKFSLRVGALAATALTLVAVSAAPALAEVADRTLPNADDRLFVLQCEGSNVPHHLLQVDVATGVLTGVGAETELGTYPCWAQGFYNPADGLIYAVDWEMDGGYTLSTIDPDTGVVTSGVSLTVAGSGNSLGVNAVAQSPEGTIYAVDSNSLFTVDPETGISTFVGDILLDSVRKGSFYSLAFNPVDGLLYGTDWSTGKNWYTIDTTDASLTVVNDTWSTTTGLDNAGLTFDSTGVAWYQVDAPRTSISSAVLPDLEGTTANVYEMRFGDSVIYAESIIYVPAAVVEPTPTPEPSAEAEAEAAPALAATGVDAGALTAGAGATALLLLAGAALLVARRRQTA